MNILVTDVLAIGNGCFGHWPWMFWSLATDVLAIATDVLDIATDVLAIATDVLAIGHDPTDILAK